MGEAQTWHNGYAIAVKDCIDAVAELTDKGDSVRPADVIYVLQNILDAVKA